MCIIEVKSCFEICHRMRKNIFHSENKNQNTHQKIDCTKDVFIAMVGSDKDKNLKLYEWF